MHQGLATVEQTRKTQRREHAADVFRSEIEIDVGAMPLAVAAPLAAYVHFHVVRTRLELIDAHARRSTATRGARFAEIRGAETEIADPQMQRRDRRRHDAVERIGFIGRRARRTRRVRASADVQIAPLSRA